MKLNRVALLLVLALASSVIPSPAQANTSSKSKVAAQIRTLFYNYSQSYVQSTVAGIKYTEKYNYPNSVVINSEEWQMSKEALISQQYRESAVPNLSTIQEDKNWKVTPSSNTCWDPRFDNKTPKGKHYIVTVNFKQYSEGSLLDTSGPADVHVSVLNNKYYFWIGICG
jgi:hypothetical protein